MKDYIFSNDFSRNLDAMIYTCGYETCEPSHSYGPVVRSGYLIHYILGGKGIYKTDGHIYQLSEGDAFLIRPNTLIYYEADKYHPWTYTWIGFQGIKIEQYLKRTSLLETPYFHYGKDDRMCLCHEKMFEAYSLLLKGTPPTRISQMLGYENYSTFLRCYKKEFGKLPSSLT